jgi:pimeloyl-ACP methyl ester carboxylesterase
VPSIEVAIALGGKMPFIASNGLTEAGTSKTVMAGGMNVHYHDMGTGEPVLFLHSYGPGTTAWITFHRAIGELSRHYRCILMNLPNFSKTGPVVYREGVHALQARTAVALLDALGIERAHWVGNSQGGQSAMVRRLATPSGSPGSSWAVRISVRAATAISWPIAPPRAAAPRSMRSPTRAARTSAVICRCISTTRPW